MKTVHKDPKSTTGSRYILFGLCEMTNVQRLPYSKIENGEGESEEKEEAMDDESDESVSLVDRTVRC